jgi:hypothetical protein
MIANIWLRMFLQKHCPQHFRLQHVNNIEEVRSFQTFHKYFIYCFVAPTPIAEQPDIEIQREVSQNRSCSFCASGPIVIDEKKAEMKFTKNVNDIQRDQYQSDKTKLMPNTKPGYFVRIQGDKTGLAQKKTHKTVFPKLKVLMILFIENCFYHVKT